MIPKFRAYIKKSKKIYPVNDLTLNGIDDEPVGINGCGDSTCTTCLDWYRFEDIELMQSTGLKDKNGVEIFEGDIVKVSVHNGFDYYDNEVCVVRKSRFHSGLVCINPNNDMECRIFNQDVLEDYQYEVIGNIYENPELLEVEG